MMNDLKSSKCKLRADSDFEVYAALKSRIAIARENVVVDKWEGSLTNGTLIKSAVALVTQAIQEDQPYLSPLGKEESI